MTWSVDTLPEEYIRGPLLLPPFRIVVETVHLSKLLFEEKQ